MALITSGDFAGLRHKGGVLRLIMVLVALCLSRHSMAVDLAQLVPDDIGMCFESDRLVEVTRQFTQSPLYSRLMVVPRLQQLVTESFEKPRAIGTRLAARLNISEAEFGERFLNGHALLAIWPGEVRDVATSRLLMLVQTRDAKFANKILEVLRDDFTRSKTSTRVSTVRYGERSYFVAAVDQGELHVEVALAVLDDVVLLASSESILRSALELSVQGFDEPGSLAQLDPYRNAIARTRRESAVRLFVNPRTWDPIVLQRLKQEDMPTEEKLVFDVLAEAWNAADYWIASADFVPHLTVNSFLHIQADKISEPLRDVSRTFAGASHYFEQVPADASLAFAGRMDLARVAQMLIQSQDPKQTKELKEFREAARGLFLGMDLFDDVLPKLGPDGGFYMTPLSDPVPDHEPPLAWIGAAQLRPQSADTQGADVALALDGALRVAMQLGESMQNSETEEPTARIDVSEALSPAGKNISIASLRGLNVLPPHTDLCYAFTPNFLMGGTGTTALKRAIGLKRSESLAASPRFKALSQYVEGAGQVLYLDGAAVRKAVKEHGKFMVDVLRRLRNEPAEDVEKRLKNFAQLAELGETILVAVNVTGEGLALTVAISGENNPSSPPTP